MASIMASKSFHFQQWLSTLQQKMQKIDFIWVNEKKINSCHYSVVYSNVSASFIWVYLAGKSNISRHVEVTCRVN